jgi:two-component system, OmpR family, alkaline phosphatase synthesis response regulator PhoP
MTYYRPVKEVLQTGQFVLDLEKATLAKGDITFYLTPKETKLLAILMKNKGTIVSREFLLAEVWHAAGNGNSRSLDVHIRWLRQKVEDNPNIPEHILTRRGLGYELRI